ncbi:hypothetical protein [Mycoplasma todarodis]|uniref:Lipoprotein n=1 Tax=Mycoplasma todarodis TaxID=1937191 RepID=A0A4R0XK18_9MOLU|nr:hypothetical protein [Mycoplasma todarodis]TCG10996.1 hypothetical protein C4B25_02540 [Mycoplasma todarodis]
MKKKYKIVLNTSAIMAVSAVGVSTVVSCGGNSKEIDTKKSATHKNNEIPKNNEEKKLPSVSGVKSWRFKDKTYATFKEAQKAKETFVNSEIDKAANKAKITNKVYEHNGVEYETKQELLKVLRKEYKVVDLFATTNANEKSSLNGFQLGNKYFKTAEEAAKAYIADGHGDGSGDDYKYRLYDPLKKYFGTHNSILGFNEIYHGANDDGFYVPRSLLASLKISKHNFDKELIGGIINGNGFSLQKEISRSLATPTKVDEINYYKTELKRVVNAIFDNEVTYNKDHGKHTPHDSTRFLLTEEYITLNNQNIKLFKGRDNKRWLFLKDTWSNGKDVASQAPNLLNIIENNVTSLKDVETIWNLIKTKTAHTTWLWSGLWNSYPEHKITFKELISTNKELSNYKPNSQKHSIENNFKVSINGKEYWFASEINGKEFAASHPIINFGNLDPKDLKSVLQANGVIKINYKDKFNNKFTASSIQEAKTKYRKIFPSETGWELDNKYFSDKASLIKFIKEKANNLSANNKTQNLVNINNINLTSLNFKSSTTAIFGLNKRVLGDGTGNSYKKVLTKGDIVKDLKSKAIEGHNYSYEQLLDLLKTNKALNDKNLQALKRIKFIAKKPNNGNPSIGKIVIKNTKTNTIVGMHGTFLSSSTHLDEDEMLYQASKTKVSNEEWFKWQTKIISRKQFRDEYKKTYERLHQGELSIDELIVNENEKGAFENIFLPSRRIVGSIGNGTMEKMGRIPNFINRRNHSQLTVSIKRSGENSFKEVSRTKDVTHLSNGDIIKIKIQKEHSSLTREIKVNGLKRGMLDFLKGSTPKDKAAINGLLDFLKEMGLDIKDKLKEETRKFTKELKEYLKADTKQKVQKKPELIKSIHSIHKLIDENVFGRIVSNDNSIINKLIEILEKNGVDTTSISDDGWTLKPKLKTLINDGLDILKVFIDNSFDFIENSIQWKPSWMTPANHVNLNTTDKQDKEFLTQLKEKMIKDAGDEKDKQDAALKTIKELMVGTFNIYKEPKDGKTTYHVVKDVNSRKIVRIFRKYLEFSPVNPKGTIDNVHINPDGKLGSILKGTLAEALKRRKNGYNNTPVKSIYNSSSNPGPINVTNINLNWILGKLKSDLVKGLLPTIKGQLNSSFDSLLNLASSVGGALLGVNGIANIKDAFNSISSASSDAFISTEANLQGLLTYIFGDEGHVVMDFEKEDNKFILKNYYSPEITTIAKSNRNTITYRKDDLEKLFNNVKPLINLLLNLIGSL